MENDKRHVQKPTPPRTPTGQPGPGAGSDADAGLPPVETSCGREHEEGDAQEKQQLQRGGPVTSPPSAADDKPLERPRERGVGR